MGFLLLFVLFLAVGLVISFYRKREIPVMARTVSNAGWYRMSSFLPSESAVLRQ